MSSRVVIKGRCIPAEALIYSLGYLRRVELCQLQRVSRLFRDAITSSFPIYPTCTPRGKRFHLVVTTESADVPIYSSIRYCPQCYLSRDNQEFLFPHLSLDRAENPRPIPEYIDIHDFTLIYGRLLDVNQLWPLSDLAFQWVDRVDNCGTWNKVENAWNRPTSFTLQYSRHHDHTGENQVALSGEALKFVLSHSVFAHSVMIYVVDLPRINGVDRLFSLPAFRYSYCLRLAVLGTCEHKVAVDDVLDYAFGEKYSSEEPSPKFNPKGREIALTVNVLERGDDDIPTLSTKIIKRFMDLRIKQFFRITIWGCRRAGVRPETSRLIFPLNHTSRYNYHIESSLSIEYRRRSRYGEDRFLDMWPILVDRHGYLSRWY